MRFHVSLVSALDNYLKHLYLNRLPSQNNEILSTHHHEAHEFVTQDAFNFICLLDSYAYPYGIDWCFNKNFLLFISTDDNRSQKQFFTSPAQKLHTQHFILK